MTNDAKIRKIDAELADLGRRAAHLDGLQAAARGIDEVVAVDNAVAPAKKALDAEASRLRQRRMMLLAGLPDPDDERKVDLPSEQKATPPPQPRRMDLVGKTGKAGKAGDAEDEAIADADAFLKSTRKTAEELWPDPHRVVSFTQARSSELDFAIGVLRGDSILAGDALLKALERIKDIDARAPMAGIVDGLVNRLNGVEAELAGLRAREAAREARFSSLDEVSAKLKGLEDLIGEGVPIRYAGVWQRAGEYVPGHFVTHQGSCWVCLKAVSGTPPGDTVSDANVSWQLAVRRGRDGKDADDRTAVRPQQIERTGQPNARVFTTNEDEQ